MHAYVHADMYTPVGSLTTASWRAHAEVVVLGEAECRVCPCSKGRVNCHPNEAEPWGPHSIGPGKEHGCVQAPAQEAGYYRGSNIRPQTTGGRTVPLQCMCITRAYVRVRCVHVHHACAHPFAARAREVCRRNTSQIM